MPVKTINPDNTAVFVCPACGKEFTGEYSVPDNSFMAESIKSIYERQICQECLRIEDEKRKNKERARKQAELDSTLDERMAKSGVPKRFRSMEKPFVRHAAEWIYQNRGKSLLISGKTGTGKTSSACFVLRLIMRQRFISVRYCSRQELFADYVRAKTVDGDNESYFLSRLDKLDLLIVDEMVGKKGDSRLSPSAQELFFNIIDGVYSQARDTRVWIIGNFYKGAIEGLVDDPEPMKRRIADSFKCAWITGDTVDDTVSP